MQKLTLGVSAFGTLLEIFARGWMKESAIVALSTSRQPIRAGFTKINTSPRMSVFTFPVLHQLPAISAMWALSPSVFLAYTFGRDCWRLILTDLGAGVFPTLIPRAELLSIPLLSLALLDPIGFAHPNATRAGIPATNRGVIIRASFLFPDSAHLINCIGLASRRVFRFRLLCHDAELTHVRNVVFKHSVHRVPRKPRAMQVHPIHTAVTLNTQLV